MINVPQLRELLNPIFLPSVGHGSQASWKQAIRPSPQQAA
jgi:hypothetical protein